MIKIDSLIQYLLIIFLLLFSNCKVNENLRVIKINGERVKVEIADTPSKRAIGLSYRYRLPENHGMLFIFPDEGRREFWMYKCNFDIDIALIDARGIITEIITMEKEPSNRLPDSLKVYLSESSQIKFAIEISRGWFKEHNIQIGTELDLKDFHAAY